MKKQMITFTTMLCAVGFLALSPIARAVVPPPEGGYPNFHTALGDQALFHLDAVNDPAIGNTAVGWYSLWSNTAGNLNTGVGAATLLFTGATSSSAVGDSAVLNNDPTGGFALNTAVGAAALLFNSGSGNTAVGGFALLNNIDGFDNNALGYYALSSHLTGAFNNAVGGDALLSDESGTFNNAFGDSALSSNVSGINNTAVGDQALMNSTGDNNIALGSGAGINQDTGSNNIYIGDAGVAGESGVIAIGRFPASGMDHDVYDNTYIDGIYGSVVTDRAVYIDSDGHLGTLASSRRYKEEIKPMGEASEGLFALKPVVFRYKQEIDPSHKLSFGLIAEEVAEVSPELVSRDKEGKPQTVRYEAVNAMLLNEFLKEHRKVQEQEATIAELKSAAAKQEANAAHQQEQIEALTAGLQKMSAQIQMSKGAPQVVVND